MDEARHLVVEKPDGSVAIAFNQEVPPPEPPPPEIIRPQARFRFSIEYHPVARALACIYLYISIWYKFGSLHENSRYYQFCVDSIYDGCSTY